MQGKPAMRGMPAKLDWTSQEDADEKFIPGIRQAGDKNFVFKKATTDGTYNLDQLLALEGTDTTFGVAYPDGKAVEFPGIPYVQFDGTGVNAPDTFTLAIFPTGAASIVVAPVLTLPLGVLGTLSVSTAAGGVGASTITVVPAFVPGNPYVYKTKAGSAEACIYDQDCSAWTPLVSGDVITVTNGYYITVTAVDAQFKAKRSGNAVCVSGS